MDARHGLDAVWRPGRLPGFVLVTALAVAGCVSTSDTGLDGWRRIVFEGDAYRARGYSATVPSEQLTLIGTTTDSSAGDEADRVEVYAIEGIEAEVVVAAVLVWAEGVSDQPSEFALYLREGVGQYPPEACAFFDPTAEGVHGPLTPGECR